MQDLEELEEKKKLLNKLTGIDINEEQKQIEEREEWEDLN